MVNCIFLSRFWEAVHNLKTLPQKQVREQVTEIWNEFLSPDASCPINVDSRSYEATKKNLEKADQWSYDVAAVCCLINNINILCLDCLVKQKQAFPIPILA